MLTVCLSLRLITLRNIPTHLKIDKALLEQYHLSDSDIKVLLSKLNNKEKGFVEDMLLELNSHSSSPYCELGLSDMQYTFEYKKWRS